MDFTTANRYVLFSCLLTAALQLIWHWQFFHNPLLPSSQVCSCWKPVVKIGYLVVGTDGSPLKSECMLSIDKNGGRSLLYSQNRCTQSLSKTFWPCLFSGQVKLHASSLLAYSQPMLIHDIHHTACIVKCICNNHYGDRRISALTLKNTCSDKTLWSKISPLKLYWKKYWFVLPLDYFIDNAYTHYNIYRSHHKVHWEKSV